ncbi:MAG: iron-containing alcohol dehydrogenase [Deltaproteobacteria bacterium]|nr:iron-containing alcohol dehydrogenase [Deltaproteobacteria bacterium]
MTARVRKKNQPISQLEALRRVRKELPPPTRTKEDEKKYRRVAARKTVRQEVERAQEEG